MTTVRELADDQHAHHDTDLADLGVDVPDWITGRGKYGKREEEQHEISADDCVAIEQGGCASGAWMPAVTYHTAGQIMAEHGDDVLDYILEVSGEMSQIKDTDSWSGMACNFLSNAVELWAMSTLEIELDECECVSRTIRGDCEDCNGTGLVSS